MISDTTVKSVLRALDPTEVSSEGDNFTIKLNGIVIQVTETEIAAYLDEKQQLTRIEDTALSAPGYFEQVVDIQGRGPAAWRLFRDNDEVTLSHSSGFSTEISPVSTRLIFSLTDADSIPRDLRRAVIMRRNPYRTAESFNLRDLFSRVISVKVRAPSGHAFFNNQKQLRSLAESSLYHLAYGYGISIVPIQSWERSLYSLETRKKEVVQFPLRTYNPELVAYYQLALGAESLILSYLALYKILEYFFTSASEHVLHEKIKEQLVAPDFSHLKLGKLRELTKTIRRFDQKMDERKMLVTVLDQYLDRDQVRNWVSVHESSNGAYYTEDRELFGEQLKIDLSDNQLFATASTRIYHIRNALVHNKEGEISRFIPFSGQEKILVKEAPLLQYIAEELILKTGKDVQL